MLWLSLAGFVGLVSLLLRLLRLLWLSLVGFVRLVSLLLRLLWLLWLNIVVLIRLISLVGLLLRLLWLLWLNIVVLIRLISLVGLILWLLRLNIVVLVSIVWLIGLVRLLLRLLRLGLIVLVSLVSLVGLRHRSERVDSGRSSLILLVDRGVLQVERQFGVELHRSVVLGEEFLIVGETVECWDEVEVLLRNQEHFGAAQLGMQEFVAVDVLCILMRLVVAVEAADAEFYESCFSAAPLSRSALGTLASSFRGGFVCSRSCAHFAELLHLTDVEVAHVEAREVEMSQIVKQAVVLNGVLGIGNEDHERRTTFGREFLLRFIPQAQRVGLCGATVPETAQVEYAAAGAPSCFESIDNHARHFAHIALRILCHEVAQFFGYIAVVGLSDA